MSNTSFLVSLCKELRENIMDSLNLKDLLLLSKATPELHAHVDRYIQRRRHILFARFIGNIRDFIELLQRTGSVVSGSSALNIIQAKQGAVKINDFDVYTTLPVFNELVHFFTEEENYKVIRDFQRPPAGPYNNTGIDKLFRLQKNNRNVDIIVTNLASAIAPIFQFHSTVVMNFISSEAIFCAYPGWTLDMTGLVHPKMYKQNVTNLSTIKSLAKYMRKGFTFYSEITELAQHDSRCVRTYYCPHMTRSTNDKGKLVWVFDRGETTASGSRNATYVDTNAVIWCLGGDQCANEKVPGSPSFVFAT